MQWHNFSLAMVKQRAPRQYRQARKIAAATGSATGMVLSAQFRYKSESFQMDNRNWPRAGIRLAARSLMPEPLTVLIPCKNERLNLRPCIESVRALADEIIVADSGSTDGSLEIAAELGIPVGNPAANANVEFAGELGSIPVSSGREEYWGHIASRDAGAVGGQITRRLVQQAEELMYGLKS